MMFIALYRTLAGLLWFASMFAIITVVLAVALVAVLLAVVVGIVSPTRSPKSTLRALVANTDAGIAQVRALKRPTGRRGPR
jgi:hypothetical protein